MKVEKKYYYFHKPTQMFACLCCDNQYMVPSSPIPIPQISIYLLQEFDPDIAHCSKNVIEESLDFAKWNGNTTTDEYGNKIPNYDFSNKQINQAEFELRECTITYNY